MRDSDTKIVWKKLYTIVLVANALYLLFFYWITSTFS
ncbi:hypothetical protein SAMN04487910_0780 [Aquimarina amphilecti]|uniref:Uncharacterized protein n=1 Tax=Aquimarina amphilecti TaxID=1038014 RepID=A0A1H7HZB4_AQUAM|nr:hypothetical protein SAMN04487910_0780 [Aquimarina amphilecti]